MNNWYIDELRVQHWALSPQVHASGLPIIFYLKARGVHYDVKHILTFGHESYTLEYWVTQVGGTHWSGYMRKITFG